MKELIFNIEDIFNNHNQNGCLSQYESSYYLIPAYQRGYKWASSKNGAVTILLYDLWNAFSSFQKQEGKEYYLQYITVKKIELEKSNCLEVIDGQQRLTTLSILLSVLSLKLEKENLADNKLDYAIRDNFFNELIYPKESLEELLNTTWEDLIRNPSYNKQDVYYMVEAAQKCNFFFSKVELLEEFYSYLLNNVKIIVNSVEKHIESETVFKNLNSNKVPLTEAELIKGLLITKVGRSNNGLKPKHFKEIMEIRMNVGRHWDELNTWANKPEIKTFFFNNKRNAMHELLTLIALIISEEKKISFNLQSSSKDFPLFNFFLDHHDFSSIFNKLIAVKNTLDDWYNNSEIYNLIGYCRFAKKSGNNNLSFLKNNYLKENKEILLTSLKDKKQELLQDIDFKTINYEETPDKIHHILLSMNVFIEGQENTKFNFYAFENEKWSLEHIFPQTPEGKSNVLKDIDKEAIRNILIDVSQEVDEVLLLDIRTDEQKEIYYNALKGHPALNSIANMCLLTGGDNSSNGNKFFHEKRDNILKLIQKGSFVPKHTFDVFSKMFEEADTANMKIWSANDINAHLSHIKSSINYVEKEEEKEELTDSN